MSGASVQFIIITTFIGMLVLYLYRDDLNRFSNLEYKDVEKKEYSNRLNEFDEKFPKVGKIPVLSNLVKWGYKEGWGYSFSVLLLLTISFILRIYRLGLFFFRNKNPLRSNRTPTSR